MKAFNYANCNINLVIRIKKAFKQAANNPTARSAFLSLLADTSSATENIFECVQNPTEMEKRLELIHTGDVSFADDLLGLSPSGDNNSRYRAYLALDNNNIIQIRIGNHYETKKALLDKANNKAQFVFQIVMVTTPPKPEAEDAVTNSTKIGNLRVLTDKIMSSDSTIDDLKNVLSSINDYLISPTTSYENATQLTESNTHKNMKKNTIKLNEQQLRNVIAESVKKVLNEVYGGYFNPNERTPNGNGQIRRSVNPNLIPQNHTGADNMVGDNARRRDYMLSMHKCPTCGKSIQDAETGYNQPFCPYCGEDLRTSSELMLGKKRGWA